MSKLPELNYRSQGLFDVVTSGEYVEINFDDGKRKHYKPLKIDIDKGTLLMYLGDNKYVFIGGVDFVVNFTSPEIIKFDMFHAVDITGRHYLFNNRVSFKPGTIINEPRETYIDLLNHNIVFSQIKEAFMKQKMLDKYQIKIEKLYEYFVSDGPCNVSKERFIETYKEAIDKYDIQQLN